MVATLTLIMKNIVFSLWYQGALFSDSQVALRKIQTNHHIKSDALTTQVLHTLHHLSLSVEVTFVWILSHSGIIGHDIADAASRCTAADPN